MIARDRAAGKALPAGTAGRMLGGARNPNLSARGVEVVRPEFRWRARSGSNSRPSDSKSHFAQFPDVPSLSLSAVGKITPERARSRAKVILGAVAHGYDPANQKTAERGTPTVAELADRFMADHVRAKRKAGTAEFYRDILDRIVKPAVGTAKADKLTRLQVGRLHSSLADTPFQANRALAVVGSMYAFAGRAGVVPEGTNPARGIDKFKESRRERFLTGVELERLGNAIREAETTGIPWTVDETKPAAKHVPKAKRFTRIAPSAAAALRLLLFTGCRLREILHLRWEHVDFEPGCLFLPDSKSGRKTVILNAPALAVLNALERVGPYIVPGDDPAQPRHDLKRPWDAVTKHAGLVGVRLHDLRHTYASFGAGGGLGLPIIGRLLGHARGDHRTLRPPRQRSATARVRGHRRTDCRGT